MLTASTVPTNDHSPAPIRRHWLKRFGAVIASVLLAGPVLARASRRSPTQVQDQESYLGEIMLAAFAVVPRGFALCNGQLLSISQNPALFALLGTNYGGNGQTTFGLPDLRGRVPRGTGTGYTLGQTGGSESPFATAGLPAHTHRALASGAAATSSSPIGAVPAVPVGTNLNGEPVAVLTYAASSNTVATNTTSTGGGGSTGGAQSPYLALNYYIATEGIFPSRD